MPPENLGPRLCSIEGCGKPHKGFGLCKPHLNRKKRYGDPLYVGPTDEQRFWALIGPGPTIRPELGPCEVWLLKPNKAGYGRFGAGNVVYYAHRYAYALRHGPIPEGMEVCHRCDNPPCTRDEHHFLGTHLDNMGDRDAKGRGWWDKGYGQRAARWKTHSDRVGTAASTPAGAFGGRGTVG